VAEEGTLSVPFMAKHDVLALRQHSWRQARVVEGVHQVSVEQFVVHPNVHFTLEATISFFSFNGNRDTLLYI
jgi:hypothetical protein